MSARGQALAAVAEAQIGQLIDLISSREDSFVRMPCPGREKLGDGSVAASAMHTAGIYRRIGAFASDAARVDDGDTNRSDDPSAAGSAPSGTRGRPSHGHLREERIDRVHVLDGLHAAREALAPIADLSDAQLSSVPAAGELRFCDGQRTLEQILTAMLKHQDHQVEAIGAAAT